jgi:hypothetical protein
VLLAAPAHLFNHYALLLLLLLLLLLQGRKYRYSGKHWLGPMLHFVSKALVGWLCSKYSEVSCQGWTQV